MTLEFLELMEEIKRRKLQKSFKSNTRIYDDGSIEVDPQAQGEPSQKDVRKQLYQLTSEIDKCFVINEASVCPQR